MNHKFNQSFFLSSTLRLFCIRINKLYKCKKRLQVGFVLVMKVKNFVKRILQVFDFDFETVWIAGMKRKTHLHFILLFFLL